MKPFLVLAGGFGTRLRSIVSDLPKPLAPVAGKPFIVRLIENWVDQGVDNFIFLLHYEAEKIECVIDKLSKEKKYSQIRFRVLTETVPLGTGGAILNALKVLNIKNDFLVANADTWLESGINQMANMEANALGAIHVSNTQRYGLLNFHDGKVISFIEKSASNGEGSVNSGLYNLTPEAFEGFELWSNFSLETDIFPRLAKNGRLKIVELKGSFIDIGVPKDYLKFCRWIESGKKNEL